MTAGELLVRATAWLAFAAYVAGTMAGLRQPAGRVFRLVWFSGAVSLLVHLLAAFHFKHGWNHAAAYADTARQTREVTGLDWGGGVWLNYLLVLVWLVDAVSRWKPNLIPQPSWLRRSLIGFYAFMWFNAAVVFVRNPIRWVGAVVFVLLAVVAWRSSRQPALR